MRARTAVALGLVTSLLGGIVPPIVSEDIAAASVLELSVEGDSEVDLQSIVEAISLPETDIASVEAFGGIADVQSGYWMIEADGEIYSFGGASSFAPLGLDESVFVLGFDSSADGGYLWVLDSTGVVHVRGGIPHFGDVNMFELSDDDRVATISATPSGLGYWVFTELGQVFRFGDAEFLGDLPALGIRPVGGIVASAPTASGNGYYMLGTDGGVFAFGDASFQGSIPGVLGPGQTLNCPIVGLVPVPDGVGYWLVACDGGVFAFGDASFQGSIPGVLAEGQSLNQPVIGMVPFSDGYLMVASDGGVFNFSDQEFFGSLASVPLDSPIVAIAAFAETGLSANGTIGSPDIVLSVSIGDAGGTAEFDGLSVVAYEPVDLTVKTYLDQADPIGLNTSVHKVYFDVPPKSLRLELDIDASLRKSANPDVAFQYFDADAGIWFEVPAEMIDQGGTPVLAAEFVLGTAGGSSAASFDGKSDVNYLGFVDGLSELTVRVVSGSAEYLAKQFADPLLKTLGYRFDPPVCVDPVSGKVVSQDVANETRIYSCVERIGDQYRVKLINNRTAPLLLEFHSPGATFEQVYDNGDRAGVLLAMAAKGKLLPGGVEVWYRVPVGSVASFQVTADPTITFSVGVIELLLDKLGGLFEEVLEAGHPISNENIGVAIEIYTCVMDVARNLDTGAILSPANIELIVHCATGAIEIAIDKGDLIRNGLGQFQKNWGKWVDVKTISKAIGQIELSADLTAKLWDLGEQLFTDPFFFFVGEVGVVIVSEQLPAGTVGERYYFQLKASGGAQLGYFWQSSESQMPKGLAVTEEGIISGYPVEVWGAENNEIFVLVTDRKTGQSHGRNFTFVIQKSEFARTIIEFDGASWFIDDRGGRHHIPTQSMFSCLVGQGVSVNRVDSQSIVDRYKKYEDAQCVEVADGQIVTHENGDSHLYSGGVLRWIPNAETFACLERRGASVVRDVPRYWILDQTKGSDVVGVCFDPASANGRLVKGDNDRAYYVDLRGGRHHIPTGAMYQCLESQGFTLMGTYPQVEIEVLTQYEDAQCLSVPSDTIVVHDDGDSHYWDGSTLRGVSDTPTFSCLEQADVSVVRHVPRYWILDQPKGAELTMGCFNGSLTPGNILESDNGKSFYVDDRGGTHHIPTQAMFQCLVSQGKDVLGLYRQSEIDTLDGPYEDAQCVEVADGQIVTHENGDSHLYSGGVLRWIPNAETFACLERRGASVVRDVPRYWILDQTKGSDVVGVCFDPASANGRLVKGDNDRAYYVDLRGGRHHIPTGAMYQCLESQGFTLMGTYPQVEIEVLPQYEDAQCIDLDDAIIVVHDDGDSYLLEPLSPDPGAMLFPIMDAPTFQCFERKGYPILRHVPRYWILDLPRAYDLYEDCLDSDVIGESRGKILESDNGKSYFVDQRWGLHHIPTTSMFQCLIDQGVEVQGIYYQSAIDIFYGPFEEAQCVEVADGQIASHADGDSYLKQSGRIRHITTVDGYNCLVRTGTSVVKNVPRYWVEDTLRLADFGVSSYLCNKVLDVNGVSYYVDTYGIRHWVPDEPTFWCLTGARGIGYWTATQSQIDKLAEGSWADCFDVESVKGKILRFPAGDTYRIGSDGKRYWIPDSPTLWCREYQGFQVYEVLMEHYKNALPAGSSWDYCADNDNGYARSYLRGKILQYMTPSGVLHDAHYIDGSGVRHWIGPTNNTNCLKGKGVPVLIVRHRQQIDNLREGGIQDTCSIKY